MVQTQELNPKAQTYVDTVQLRLLLDLYKERGASPQEWEDLQEVIRSIVKPSVERYLESGLAWQECDSSLQSDS